MKPPPSPIYHADFTLTDDQQAVGDVFATFFSRECPPQRVRDAEPHGFDADLWKLLGEMNVAGMAVDPEVGGDGAGLVELVLLCEQWGKHLGPVPLAEVVVAARLLARLAPSSEAAAAALGAAIDGSQLVTIALHPAVPDVPQLVPAAAVADQVVAVVGETIVVVPAIGAEAVANLGHTPLAWLDVTAARGAVVAQGPEVTAAFAAARRDWQVVMAAALTGMADATLAIAVEHARARIAFGVPIGSFQAVAHPLVDVATNVETARRLTRKAAWWADTDPAAYRELVPMAYHFAEHTAVHGTTVGVHTLGGVGFTVESDVQLYFRRAKGWALVGGDPGLALDEAAVALLGDSTTEPEVAA